MPIYVPDFMVATIKVNSKAKGGWSEKYVLNTTDYATAKTTLATIINFRSAILAAGFSVIDGTCSKQSLKGDSVLPSGYSYLPTLLAAEGAIEACNEPGDGLLYRFDTGTGKKSNRLIRGVRDSWILDFTNQLAVTVITDFTGIGARPAFGTSMVNALTYFLKAVAVNTFLAVDRNKLNLDPAPDPSQRYEMVPFVRIQYRKAGHRDTGAGYSYKRGRKKKKV